MTGARGINDWSASVPACNERRFDAKKSRAARNAKGNRKPAARRNSLIFLLVEGRTLFALSRSLQAGTLALQSFLLQSAARFDVKL